jgi:hypothetical protein
VIRKQSNLKPLLLALVMFQCFDMTPYLFTRAKLCLISRIESRREGYSLSGDGKDTGSDMGLDVNWQIHKLDNN